MVGSTDLALFQATAMGDLFLKDDSGVIHFLDTMDGKFFRFADTEQEFWSKLEDRSVRRTVLGSMVVRGLLSEGKTIGPGECFSPNHPPKLGGKLTSENLNRCSLPVHTSIMGQIHRQLKALPPGAKINLRSA